MVFGNHSFRRVPWNVYQFFSKHLQKYETIECDEQKNRLRVRTFIFVSRKKIARVSLSPISDEREFFSVTCLPLRRIVETLDQLKAGGFAATGSADERHRLAPIDLQVQALQHLHVLSRRVLEVYALELDLAGDGAELLALRAQAVDRRDVIEHLEDRRGRAARHRERLEMRRCQAHVLRAGQHAEEHDHQHCRRVLLHLLRPVVQDQLDTVPVERSPSLWSWKLAAIWRICYWSLDDDFIYIYNVW